jgi:threonylcarbamoyladenosine tRNA methylthiotransferase MtaB
VTRVTAHRTTFALGADVIAGFPGEREEDHRATLALVEELPFSYLHVFPYSRRPGTAAERLPDQVEPTVIARRARELREAGARKAAAYRRSRVSGQADVVVIGADGRREGLTEDYLTVSLADSSLPRGSRVAARLVLEGDRLTAVTHGSREG